MNDDSTFVEDLLKQLRETPAPSGPSPALLRSTAAALAERSLDGTAPGRKPPRRASIAARLASGLLGTTLIAAAVWLAVGPHSRGVAFADVQQKLAKTRTVRFLELRTNPVEKDKPKDADVIETESDAEAPRRHFVRGRFLKRVETLDDKGEIDWVSISDAKAGRHVILEPKEKKFALIETQVTIDLETGKTTEQKIEPAPNADYIELLSEVPPQATTKLPPRTLDGQEVIGFLWESQIEKKQGTDTWKRTYWVNARTKTIVRIEISHRSTDPRIGASDWVQTDFAFDQEMPDSLFSTEPPAGYTSEVQSIQGIRVE